MKINYRKWVQSFIIILCILMKPKFSELVGINIDIHRINIVSRIIADVVILAGMAQIAWVIIFYIMKFINPSILKE